MKYGSLILEKKEFVALKRIMKFHRHYEDYLHKDALEQLTERLASAIIKDEKELPDDVVRLNSEITFKTLEGKISTVQLVIPAEENQSKRNLSVMSTLGANLVGLAEGDKLMLDVPHSISGLKISKVIKPNEALPNSFSIMDF